MDWQEAAKADDLWRTVLETFLSHCGKRCWGPERTDEEIQRLYRAYVRGKANKDDDESEVVYV